METVRIWIIEDDKEATEQIRDQCAQVCSELSLEAEIYSFTTPLESRDEIEKGLRPDLMVVDLNLGDNVNDRSGWDAVREIISRKVIPVVVYSAYSGEIPEELFQNALISRVKKGNEQFISVLRKFLRITLNFKNVKNLIEGEFEKLSLETVGKLFGNLPHDSIDKLPDDLIVQLAVTRLISFLLHSPLDSVSRRLPPESIYIYPPFERGHLLAGDFIQRTRDRTIWLVASPSCDLECSLGRKPKVNRVLLLRCYTSYEDTPFNATVVCNQKTINNVKKTDKLLLFVQKHPDKFVYKESAQRLFIKSMTSKEKDQLKGCIDEDSKKQEIEEAFSKAAVDKAKSELKDRKETIRLLKCPPAIFGHDYILVYFKNYETFSYKEIISGLKKGTWKILTSLATPYSEDLKNLFMRDLLRLGTPDTSNDTDEKGWAEKFCSG